MGVEESAYWTQIYALGRVIGKPETCRRILVHEWGGGGGRRGRGGIVVCGEWRSVGASIKIGTINIGGSSNIGK